MGQWLTEEAFPENAGRGEGKQEVGLGGAGGGPALSLSRQGSTQEGPAPVLLPQGGGLPEAALLGLRQPLGHLLLQPHGQLGLQLQPLALVARLGARRG